MVRHFFQHRGWCIAVVASLALAAPFVAAQQKGKPVKRAQPPKFEKKGDVFYSDAFLEDPPVLLDDARISWDIPIHSVADIRALASRPAAINVKPARLGSWRALFELYDECAKEGIAVYGGGQHELGPGRRQIQLLASLFHPDGPNDVAPSDYNDAGSLPSALPRSPLVIPLRPGFG